MKKIVFSLLTYVLVFIVISTIHSSFAANVQFDPATVSVAANQTTPIKVNISLLPSEKSNGADIFIKYDPAYFDISSVNNGDFYPVIRNETTTSGTVVLRGNVEVATPKTGTGTMATLVLKAKKEGSTTVSVSCTPNSTTESNIYSNDINASDIIDCSANNQTAISIGTASNSNSASTTSTSTSTTTTSGSSTPSELPRTGLLESIESFAIPGIILLIVGSALKFLL